MSKKSISPIQEIALDLTAKDVAEQFQPYAIELGAFVYGWNQLHDDLGELFWGVIGGTNGAVPLAIWHSTNSDRTQREMLRAASEAKYHIPAVPIDNPLIEKRKEARSRIKWLLDETNRLANYRNDIIHAPYWFLKGTKRLVPNTFLGNLRAKALINKDLLTEFRWCRATASALSDFARRMDVAVRNFDNAQPPWPDIPELPPRGDGNETGPHPQQHRPRKPKRQTPPRSSPA